LASKKKIGEFLVERNFMTVKQVEQVLELQKNHLDERFGEIAFKLSYINDDALNQYNNYIIST
jgi:hypothetical protein